MADHTSNAADIMDEIDRVIADRKSEIVASVVEPVRELGAMGGECVETLSAIVGLLTADDADACPLCLEVLDVIKQGTIEMMRKQGR